jgi:hypothetical protein
MSCKVRFAATVFVLAVLVCGSLEALPFSLRPAPIENRGEDFVTAALEWIASIFVPDRDNRPANHKPRSPQTKEGSTMDPHGCSSCG